MDKSICFFAEFNLSSKTGGRAGGGGRYGRARGTVVQIASTENESHPFYKSDVVRTSNECGSAVVVVIVTVSINTNGDLIRLNEFAVAKTNREKWAAASECRTIVWTRHE